jgi:AraC family transcriptional regulator
VGVSRLYLEGLGVMLAVHVLRSYSSSTHLQILRKGGLAPWQARRVRDYIEAHLSDELGLIELAKIAGLSPHHFGAAFKITVGKSPHQFAMERRIKHALELLVDEDLSIAEIAHAVGFSSHSHFTANFRRTTGLTPGQYRRSLG